MRIGGRVLLEFTTQPPNLNQLIDHNNNNIVFFDVTRRRENRSRCMVAEEGQLSPLFNDVQNSIVDFPLQNELANDDKLGTEENNTPINNTIYGWDAPGLPRSLSHPYDFIYRRITFEEFVRVYLFNERTPQDNGNIELGSRASKKWEWHDLEYLKLINMNGLVYDYDLASTSYSYPRFSGNGNGNISIDLLNNPVTKAYTVIYSSSNNQWTLTSIQNLNVMNRIAVGNIGDNTWQLELDDEVKVNISQGSTLFTDGDKFSFSIFKEANGKANKIELGRINVGL